MRVRVARLLRPLRTSWVRRQEGDLPWIGGLLLALVALEVFARRTASDLVDVVGVAALIGLTVATLAALPRRFPAAAAGLRRSGARLRERLARAGIEIGIDFRGEPPLPRRLPPVLWVPLVGALAVVSLLAATHGAWPSTARDALRGVSGLAYLIGLSALWTLLAGGALMLFLLPLALLGSLLESRAATASRPPHAPPPPARAETVLWVGAAYFVAVACAAALAPAWVPLALLAASAALHTALLFAIPSCRALVLMWRGRAAGARVATLSWAAWTSALELLAVAVVGVLVLVARGDRLAGPGSSATSVTAFLGLVFAWVAAATNLVYVVDVSRGMVLGRLGDPARRVRSRVHVRGVAERSARRAVRRSLRRAGFAVRFGDGPPEAGDGAGGPALVVDGRRAPRADADPFAPAWPRRVGIDELVGGGAPDAELAAALRRRSEIASRRALVRGLQRVFRAAARRRYQRGSGFWLCPHVWFVTHLSRDTDEEGTWAIGPAYRTTVPRHARHHLHVVLKALDFDLVFVEDGVGFRRLRRVLRVLFECYDVFGGQRLEQEAHFFGLPGVRVLFHEYSMGRPLARDAFPEPDYEELGRARLLLVFRDRGGAKEDLLSPRDADRTPAPRELLPV